MVTSTQESCKKENNMVTERRSTQVVKLTKDSSQMVKKMEKESQNGLMETDILEIS